jgi:tryptophanyl-tRNA synthetase
MRVTPWEVEGKIDYTKLIKHFGTSLITEEMLEWIKKYAKELHVMLRRGFFFSHRDLDKVLKDVDEGRSFFLYTGRGPSGPMHIGHLIPFLFTKWLQDTFGVNLYIEISDDEKFLVKQGLSWEEVKKWSYENILDIIAVGFDPDKTFIFRDSEFVKNVYPLMLKIAKKTNFSKAKAVFGFNNLSNIGIIFYPSFQIVPTFFEKKRCLIPCAIDQDPYWRIQRDIAESLGYFKTSVIHSKFFPPLTGVEGKMSTSEDNTIWLSDGEDVVRRKVFKYAFSGGQPTVELHRKLGGNPDVDVCFQWLRIFLEEDDAKIKEIEDSYRAGELLTGELKQITIEKINTFLKKHNKRRAKAHRFYEEFLYKGKLAQKMWDTVFE